MHSREYFRDPPSQEELQRENMIHFTRRIVGGMSQEQRFAKAEAHVMDALKYKQPRPESESLDTPRLFRCMYGLHSSLVWEWALFALAYLYMYMVVLDRPQYWLKIGLELPVLLVFWVEVVLLLYCRSFDHFNRRKNVYSNFVKFKVALIALMTLDLVLFIALPGDEGDRPIRPFRVLRCLVPLLFDAEMRKTMLSLAKAYKDVLVYFIFFGFVIVGYAVIGTASLHYDPHFRDPDFPQRPDPYKTNFGSLSAMIFMVYVTATYDSYPDNQILAVQNYEPNYAFYIIFIFMNMFLFSSIPGTLVYNEYRDARSKILLVDEIRQQHSLLIAFVTLAEDERNLRISTLIQFLLYLYKEKIRFVEHITDICLKIDDNNDQTIVKEFMQLSKILLENQALLPPAFRDLRCWEDFRKWATSLGLKRLVKSLWFELVVAVLIALSIVNALHVLFAPSALTETFDDVFVWLFGAELLLRFVGVGPENYFMDRYNKLDSLVIFIGLVLFFPEIASHSEAILRLLRVFRVASFVKRVGEAWGLQFTIWRKLSKIFVILLEIFPIIFKFFPLFLFFFYLFGVVGMELFFGAYATTGSPAYNMYQQFSSFRSFMQSQYIMMQILTEAGWSMVAYDHCWRSPHYYAYTMLYFCLMHIVITYIIATLIKGIFWEVFFTVAGLFEQRERQLKEESRKDAANALRAQEMREVEELINSNEFIDPDTVLKRELIDNKIDQKIFRRLKSYRQSQEEHELVPNRHASRKKNLLVTQMMQDWNVERSEIHSQHTIPRKRSGDSVRSKEKMKLEEIEEVDEEDFESEMSSLLDDLILNPKIRYSEIVASPKIFMDFLKGKLRAARECVAEGGFSEHYHPLSNAQSMDFHVCEVHEMLGIETSKREQKAMIISSLQREGKISEEVGERLLRKQLNEKVFTIDTEGTLRSLFLSGTDEQLIRKFEVEYFSDLYGHAFKEINKMTLFPLLKLESTLTYSLRNILRYPQIDNTQFFEMVTHIQDQISNRLLQRGSLFKFLYKMEHEGDVWFSVEFKQQQSMKVHFVKTGIWAYHRDMQPATTYYARDVFNWDIEGRQDRDHCLLYMKRFFQTFEGLAYSLIDPTKFFLHQPATHVYDLFLQTFDVRSSPRFMERELEIQKVMVVVLSKEQERKDISQPPLPYRLSTIRPPHQQSEAELEFRLDESDNQTFEKLKNLAAMDTERIVESEGLPFAYIVNLMQEIADIMALYDRNFIFQIEKVLNDQFILMNEEEVERLVQSQR